ncbi:hypothetical protein D3C74_411970 [compost metagenome]
MCAQVAFKEFVSPSQALIIVIWFMHPYSEMAKIQVGLILLSGGFNIKQAQLFSADPFGLD